MWGYGVTPDKTEEEPRGGWLRTGDLDVMDRDVYLTMRGRRFELTRVNGVASYPREMEEAHFRIEGVREAALVDLPDATFGARPIALLRLNGPANLDEAAIKAPLGAELPYDLSRLVVPVVGAFPMIPTGKVAKSDLAAQLKDAG